MIACIIQARMSSGRLPGKVLAPIAGIPMIRRVVDRCMQVRGLMIPGVGRIIVAVPAAAESDPLISYLQKTYAETEIEIYPGDKNDVLQRYAKAAAEYDADTVIRITADCPLIDPVVIENVLAFHAYGGYDYTTNRPGYPDGMDVEVMTVEALAASVTETNKLSGTNFGIKAGRNWMPRWREHVTTWLREVGCRSITGWEQPRFQKGELTSDVAFPGLKLSVDTESDRLFVEAVIERWGDAAGMNEVPDIYEWAKAEGKLGAV